MANGLEVRLDAAPVDSGTPPVLVPVGLEVLVRERVADVMVLLRPTDGLTVAEAVATADDVIVPEADADEDAALRVEATEEETAEETASEPVTAMGPM